MTSVSVNDITARHLDHLDSLGRRHAYQLNSRVGCKVYTGIALPLPVYLSINQLNQLKPEVPGFESFLLKTQTGGGAHQASYSMDTGILWSQEYNKKCMKLRG